MVSKSIVRHLQHSCYCFATVSAFAYCGCSPEIRMYRDVIMRDLLAPLAMCNMIRRLSQMLFSTI
ncbi:hypothetical protein T4B_2790 [Trichinella pseudospiralis]|uniref:Uncharacterized protein n=2 Tax=Trichinella pseudospiralis TaxID=6337 RepID=A0A0V1GHZ5_TRIPS|nr:hypothetical protein T4B_2790 [Trichinella pseudospiralis]